MPIPGYYNLADRGQQLNAQLSDTSVKWDVTNSQALQLGTTTAYGPRLLAPLLPVLREVVKDPAELKLLEQLAAWKGDYRSTSTSKIRLLQKRGSNTIAASFLLGWICSLWEKNTP